MSDIYKSLKQYPRPDKRKKPKISPSLTPSISERTYAKSESIAIDKFIESQVGLVSKCNIERWINSITSFHNRHSKSIFIHQVANWLKKELEISGYNNKKEILSFREFMEAGFVMKNVICSNQGETNKIILICGHYDTILGDNVEDTVSRAPGANDNASGVAAILEIARILFAVDLKYSIRFVFFSGEEQGLRGSEYYSEYIKRQKEDLVLVINLDMVGEPGFLATPRTVQIDVDKYEDEEACNKIKENDKASETFAWVMKQMAENYTNLKGEYGAVYASDYCPFEARGYVVIGTYDGLAEEDRNPHYHSCSDMPANLDMDFLTSVTKMVHCYYTTY